MEENKSLYETEGENGDEAVTKQETSENNDTPGITIKYNKEIKELSPEEAKDLAQKGLKYEQIENDYIRLKNIAKNSGLCVSELIGNIEREKADRRKNELLNKCGGNSELADYILSLENEKQSTGDDLEELKSMFPEIKEIGELPQEVIEFSNLNGKNLLDSYLRYLYGKKVQERAKLQQKKAEEKTRIGSLRSNSSDDASALNREFIKGLWNR